MPYVVSLKREYLGMDRFLNVDFKVGDASACINSSDDVRAVQRLLQLAITPTYKFKPGIPTGVLDVATAYFIYAYQLRQKEINAGAKIDGFITPAIHAANYGTGVWTIIHINSHAAKHNRPAWLRILADYPIKSAA